MIKIIFLGTTAAITTAKRDNTALLIKTPKEQILIDSPGSLIQKLARTNIDFRRISTVFFTHSHPDHIYGIISLLHSQYKLKNQLHIYAHPRVIILLKALRKIFQLEDTNKYPKLIYHKIKAGTGKPFYNSAEVRVSALKVEHTPESLGFKFLFKRKAKTMVFSGDTALSQNLLKEAYKANYLIHDCFAPQRIFKKYPQLYKMHTSSLLLGEIASLCQVKTVIPIHFGGEVKYTFAEISREIKKNFSGKVIIPADLQILTLS